FCPICLQNEYVHFGRVLVMPDFRGKSYAQTLLRSTLAFIQQQFPNYPIEIQAQHYLQEFYQKFGFVVVSDIYLEDNIPHIDMRKF
ncbi:acetyltransferase, partial [Gallibacterium genomosp. 2]